MRYNRYALKSSTNPYIIKQCSEFNKQNDAVLLMRSDHGQAYCHQKLPPQTICVAAALEDRIWGQADSVPVCGQPD